MSDSSEPKIDPEQPVNYEIRIEGHLSSQWTDWFDGLTVSLKETGETCLTGLVIDQAALYGLLKKVRDLGMPLVSVNRLGAIQVETTEVNEPHQDCSTKE